jgi:predicted dehydrogenase
MSTPTHCRWGILGAAFIARKNWQAIRDAGNANLVAVASRNLAKAMEFNADCQMDAPHPKMPDAVGSYEELLARDDVDAVYIPLPTGVRKEWVIRAASAGKHVLVEKPVGTNADDVREMIAACESHKVQFMDGVMFMHSRRLPRLREVLDDPGRIGHIRRISSQFSFAGDDEFMRKNIRVHGALEPLGCLGDLGWYCVRFSLWALKYHMPLRVSAHFHAEAPQDEGAHGVPTEMSAEMIFPDGVSAAFHCSFLAENAEWAHVSGTKGSVLVPDFVLPFSGDSTSFAVSRPEFVVKGCRVDMHEGRVDEHTEEPSSNAPGAQEAEMFRTFSSLVLEGRVDPLWPEIALQTQLVVDACIASARIGGASVALEH